MKLKTLVLKHFKGIETLTLQFDGKNASIYADNGLGKTTIFDAYNWLLTGKDSLNRKDFGIKTLDSDGKELHNIDHTVEAEFVNPDLKLTRIYREKYTKVKGQPIPGFTGHTTDYYVNDREVKETEYKTYVNGAIADEMFKLLSNPLYFNVSLKLEERKIKLFEMCPDIKDADIFKKNPSLSELTSYLGQNTVEQHMRVIKNKLKEIDEEIQKKPIQIDEAQKSIGGVENLNLTDLKQALEALKISKDLKFKERAGLIAGGQGAKLDLEIAKIDADIQTFINKFNKIQADARMAQYKLFEEATKKSSSKLNEINTCENDIVKITNEITVKEKEKADKLAEYHQASSMVYAEPPPNLTCPTCLQSLPEEKVQAAKDKALADFNLAKSQKIEKIKADGLEMAGMITRLKAEFATTTGKKETLTKELETLKAQKESLETKDDTAKVETQVEYIALLETKQKLFNQSLRSDIPPSDSDGIAKIDELITKFDTEEAEINASIAKLNAAEKTKNRIEELTTQQKALGVQFAHWSKQKNLCEQFTKAKIETVESVINSKFAKTKWKMFDQQDSGELKECCLATFEGVPYSDLNNAMRINLGLDIINALSNHYKDATGQPLRVPIFVDNAESVTALANMETQVIRLVVSESDKVLRLEVDE